MSNRFRRPQGDKDDAAFLEHILIAIEGIEQCYQSSTEPEDMRWLAIERCFEIIGEAVKRLAPEIKKQRGDIPWSKISDTRNYIIHGYFGINHGLLEEAIIHDIPNLKLAIAELLSTIK